MKTSIPHDHWSTIRVRAVGLFATAILTLGPVHSLSAQDESVVIQQGQSATHTLSGDEYRRLSSVRVLLSGRETRDVTATLGRSNRDGRRLTIRVGDRATVGSDYTVEGIFGRSTRQRIPISLEVTARRQSGDRNQGSGGRQSGDRTQGQRGDSGDSQGDRNSREQRDERMDRDRRSQGRGTNDRIQGQPDRRQSDRQQSDRDSRSEQDSQAITISPAGQREIQFTGSRYRAMSELRVVHNGRVSSAIEASIERTRQGATVQLFVGENARVSEYTLQARINNRWVTIPVELSVADLPREYDRDQPQREYRHRETITLEDGTRIVIGGESQSEEDEEPFVPTPIVTDWSPQKFADIGDILTIEGTNLSDDLLVKIGDTNLQIQSRSATQITAILPSSSDECPPGTLQVVRQSGTLIRSCQPHYFVRGDKPLHHIVENTSHNYINSYLFARLSRVVYNDYFGVTSWNAFRSEFEDEVTSWGATSVEFLRSNGGPGDTELAIVSTPAVVIVVFRGSESFLAEEGGFSDWFHTNPDTDRLMVNSWQAGAWVHEGFYNAYDDVHDQLENRLRVIRNNGQSVFITGHSLGGALSTMAAYRLDDEGIPIQGIYTYGSPRVGNSEWEKAYYDEGLLDRTQRWVNRQDFAPRYPISDDWHHVGLTNNIHQNGSVDLDDTEVSVVAFPNGGDHNMDRYCEEILQELSFSQKNKVEDAAN